MLLTCSNSILCFSFSFIVVFKIGYSLLSHVSLRFPCINNVFVEWYLAFGWFYFIKIAGIIWVFCLCFFFYWKAALEFWFSFLRGCHHFYPSYRSSGCGMFHIRVGSNWYWGDCNILQPCWLSFYMLHCTGSVEARFLYLVVHFLYLLAYFIYSLSFSFFLRYNSFSLIVSLSWYIYNEVKASVKRNFLFPHGWNESTSAIFFISFWTFLYFSKRNIFILLKREISQKFFIF